MKTNRKLPSNFTWICVLFEGYLPTDPFNTATFLREGKIRRFNEKNLSLDVKYQDGKWYTGDIIANSGKFLLSLGPKFFASFLFTHSIYIRTVSS